MHCNWSSDSLAYMQEVSKTMPRNVREVEDLLIFSVARGIPSSSQTCWRVARFSWHQVEEACPIVGKFTNYWSHKDTPHFSAIHDGRSAKMLNSLGADLKSQTATLYQVGESLPCVPGKRQNGCWYVFLWINVSAQLKDFLNGLITNEIR